MHSTFVSNENSGCYFISHKVSLRLHQLSHLSTSDCDLPTCCQEGLRENKAYGMAEEEWHCFHREIRATVPIFWLKRRIQEAVPALTGVLFYCFTNVIIIPSLIVLALLFTIKDLLW